MTKRPDRLAGILIDSAHLIQVTINISNQKIFGDLVRSFLLLHFKRFSPSPHAVGTMPAKISCVAVAGFVNAAKKTEFRNFDTNNFYSQLLPFNKL